MGCMRKFDELRKASKTFEFHSAFSPPRPLQWKKNPEVEELNTALL
jgi:hypothetical protein